LPVLRNLAIATPSRTGQLDLDIFAVSLFTISRLGT
jgi:hypothetical protein